MSLTGNKIKLIYLLSYMGFAFWRVFYNVFLEENNFTGLQIGIINGLAQAMLFLFVPIWGFVAEKKGIRPTLQILVVATAALMFFLGYIRNFELILIYLVLLTFFYHPIGALTDALGTQFSEIHREYDYGKFRLWGSLGWAVASFLGGFIFLYFNVSASFYISAALFALLIPLIRIPKNELTRFKPHPNKTSIKVIFKNRKVMMVIPILVLYGMACSPVFSFTNLYFTELKANSSIIGLAYAIMAISELPFFFYGARLVRLIGSKLVIIIALTIMLIRLMIYGFFPSITTGLLMGAFQGLTLSFFLVGVVTYLHQVLPAGNHATAQTIIWSFFSGAGMTVGSLIIGYLKDKVGIIHSMTYAGYLAFGIIILVIIFLKEESSINEDYVLK